MNGFYSIWSAPYLHSKKVNEYRMHDFELITMVLSNSMWKKLNGNTSLIADDKALKYLDKYDILRLFNGSVDVLNVDKDINSTIFWAAGKLFALKMLDEPKAMVDLDLIVWKNMDYSVEEYDIYVIHREEITQHVYPDYEHFNVDDYKFNPNWNKNVLPCNTALLCYKDNNFIKEYADESIKFMKSCTEKNDNLCPMVFAEQRLLPIMADLNGKSVGSIFPLASDIADQSVVTHIWGHKNILKFNYEERYKFCQKSLKRLAVEDVEAFNIITKIPSIQKYL